MLTRRQALIRAAAAGAGVLVRGASDAFAAAAQQTFPPASQPATPVNFAVPPGASDCHLHIIDPRRFPFAESAGRESASVEQSRALHRALHIDRVVLIQSPYLQPVRPLGSGSCAAQDGIGGQPRPALRILKCRAAGLPSWGTANVHPGRVVH